MPRVSSGYRSGRFQSLFCIRRCGFLTSRNRGDDFILRGPRTRKTPKLEFSVSRNRVGESQIGPKTRSYGSRLSLNRKGGVSTETPPFLCLVPIFQEALGGFVGYYFVSGGVGGRPFGSVVHVVCLLAGELDVREPGAEQPVAVYVHMLGACRAGHPVLRR